MQGLPIQNLMKMPKNVDAKSTKSGVQFESDANDSGLELFSGKSSSSNESKNIDFSSLLNEVKSKNANGIADSNKNIEKNSQVFEVKIEDGELNNKLSKSSTGLDQLLNTLKGTTNESAAEGIEEQVPTRNFFPKQEKPQNLDGSNLDQESPLDFLVKNSKQKNVSENGKADFSDKKAFFVQSEKLANNLQAKSDLKSDAKNSDKFTLISGEEFVDVKNKIPDNKEINLNKKNIDLSDVIQKDVRNNSKVQGYQNGQNLLNDSMIRTSKDLAFKDGKKTKHSSIEELLSPDLKKSHELSLIKESPLMVPVMAKENNQLGADLKSNEAVKVLDLSKMNSTNTNQIIEKISDYVMQSQVAGKDKLDLIVKHDSLGQFQIQVNKVPNQNQIDMQIVTNNHEGHKFFVEHEAALVKTLQQSGIQLSDFRIVSSMTDSSLNSFGESKQFSSFSQNQNSSSEQHQSFQSFSSGDFRQGKERRNELWNEYREKYGA